MSERVNDFKSVSYLSEETLMRHTWRLVRFEDEIVRFSRDRQAPFTITEVSVTSAWLGRVINYLNRTSKQARCRASM